MRRPSWTGRGHAVQPGFHRSVSVPRAGTESAAAASAMAAGQPRRTVLCVHHRPPPSRSGPNWGTCRGGSTGRGGPTGTVPLHSRPAGFHPCPCPSPNSCPGPERAGLPACPLPVPAAPPSPPPSSRTPRHRRAPPAAPPATAAPTALPDREAPAERRRGRAAGRASGYGSTGHGSPVRGSSRYGLPGYGSPGRRAPGRWCGPDHGGSSPWSGPPGGATGCLAMGCPGMGCPGMEARRDRGGAPDRTRCSGLPVFADMRVTTCGEEGRMRFRPHDAPVSPAPPEPVDNRRVVDNALTHRHPTCRCGTAPPLPPDAKIPAWELEPGALRSEPTAAAGASRGDPGAGPVSPAPRARKVRAA